MQKKKWFKSSSANTSILRYILIVTTIIFCVGCNPLKDGISLTFRYDKDSSIPLLYNFTVQYGGLTEGNRNNELYLVIVPGPNGSDHQDRYIMKIWSDTPLNNTVTTSYLFPAQGTYVVWAELRNGTEAVTGGFSDRQQIIVSGGGNGGSLAEAMLTEAERYLNYPLTWYNRNGNVRTDEGQPQTMWTRSVPYSLLNSDVLETIVSKCGVWTQPYQTRWYQYSPGKLGYNNYDKEYSGDAGYPWPTDFDSWTGTCCQAFVYNCAKKVGYNFTSDENYRNEVTLWATLGTQIEYYEVQRGDIVYFEGGYHVGIVLTPDHSNPNNTVILQALGEYQSPFYFQVSTATVGQTIQVYIGTQPNPVFRRLPQQ